MPPLTRCHHVLFLGFGAGGGRCWLPCVKPKFECERGGRKKTGTWWGGGVEASQKQWGRKKAGRPLNSVVVP